MKLTNLNAVEDMISTNLNETLQSSNEQIQEQTPSRQEEQANSAEMMFNDDESMNFLMNKIGLAIQRDGG